MKNKFRFLHLFKKTYYKKLIVAFFLFMLIPVLIVGELSYNVSRNSLINEVSENNQQKIQQITLSIESTLKNIDSVVLQLMQNIYVQDLLRETNNISYTDINKVLNLITNIENANSFIQALYVYKSSDKTIYTSKVGMMNFDDFYDNDWLKHMSLYQEEFQQKKVLWLDTRNVSNKIASTEYKVITLIRPAYINAANKGVIVVNIDEEKLLQTLDPIRFKDGSRVFILNREGRIISHKNKQIILQELFKSDKEEPNLEEKLKNKLPFTFEYSGVKYIISLRQSEYNNWIYVYMIPEEEYLKPGDYIKEATFITCGIIILLGIIMSLLISRSMYNPVNEIIKEVSISSRKSGGLQAQSENIKNEFEYIKMSFNEVYSKSRKMEFIIDNNSELLVETYFKQLLEPESNVNIIEIQKKLKNLGVFLDTGVYMVFVIEFPLDWEVPEDRHKCIVEDIYKYFRDSNSSIISVRIKHQNVFILNNASFKEKKIIEDLYSLNEVIREKYGVTYTTGVGSVVKYNSMNVSFQKAQKGLQRKFLEGIYGIYEDMSDVSEELVYKPLIDKIVTNIKLSQMENVKLLLGELMGEIKNKRIPYKVVLQIYFNLYVRLFLILEDSGNPSDGILDPGSIFYENIKQLGTIDELNEYMYIRIMDINLHLCKDKVYKNSEVIEKVVEHIGNNYHQPISLNDVADRVLITPTYLGILFREEMGCTFLDYLTKLRVDKARQLLTDTGLSVSAIGKKVGYENEQSFIRNFKKLVAQTPNQYRIKSSKL